MLGLQQSAVMAAGPCEISKLAARRDGRKQAHVDISAKRPGSVNSTAARCALLGESTPTH